MEGKGVGQWLLRLTPVYLRPQKKSPHGLHHLLGYARLPSPQTSWANLSPSKHLPNRQNINATILTQTSAQHATHSSTREYASTSQDTVQTCQVATAIHGSAPFVAALPAPAAMGTAVRNPQTHATRTHARGARGRADAAGVTAPEARDQAVASASIA